MDVCKQMLEILRGGLPTSAVNAPIILPEQYAKLQPSVRLVEKMGRLYTQHYVRSKGGMVGGRRFELVYRGELAGMPNTKPLFAALVKGLVASFSDSNVNIVNAELIAREKGIVINETQARDSPDTYANLVTLRSVGDGAEGVAGGEQQVIEGYASDKRVYISKLDRFKASFSPEGTLIILHNYDEPGKIGGVGMVLGSHGINIRFMQVAGLGGDGNGTRSRSGSGSDGGGGAERKDNEALMILGVDGEVGESVLEGLRAADGVLDVNLVRL